MTMVGSSNYYGDGETVEALGGASKRSSTGTKPSSAVVGSLPLMPCGLVATRLDHVAIVMVVTRALLLQMAGQFREKNSSPRSTRADAQVQSVFRPRICGDVALYLAAC
jgi:hypothetical protein